MKVYGVVKMYLIIGDSIHTQQYAIALVRSTLPTVTSTTHNSNIESISPIVTSTG